MFSGALFGARRVRRVVDAFGVRGRALVVLPPVPGFGEVFVCRAWSTALLGAGRGAGDAPRSNPEPGLDAWLSRLRAIEPRERPAAIEAKLAARLHLPAIEARLREVRSAAAPARRVGLALFAVVFVAGPVLHATGLLVAWSVPILAIGLILHATAVAARLRADRRLHGPGETSAWSEGMKLALSPLSSMRGGEHALVRALAEFEPLAVAWVLTDPAQFQQVARESLDGIGDPVPSDPLAADVQSRYGARIERLLRRTGVRPGQLELPSEPLDGTTRSFCPRCRNEYVVGSGACAECGLALRPLERRATDAQRALLRRMDLRRRRGRKQV